MKYKIKINDTPYEFDWATNEMKFIKLWKDGNEFHVDPRTTHLESLVNAGCTSFNTMENNPFRLFNMAYNNGDEIRSERKPKTPLFDVPDFTEEYEEQVMEETGNGYLSVVDDKFVEECERDKANNPWINGEFFPDKPVEPNKEKVKRAYRKTSTKKTKE